MALRREDILRDVLRAVGSQALARVRPLIPSSTLRDAVRLIVDESMARGELFIPHYWAVYVHDGTAPFGTRDARFLVFFDDPRDDPRQPRPERFVDARRLTKEEFDEGLRINAERRASGGRPYMFVVRRVGAARGTPFFEEGMRGFVDEAGPTIARIFDQAVQDAVDSGDFPTEQGSARFPLS